MCFCVWGAGELKKGFPGIISSSTGSEVSPEKPGERTLQTPLCPPLGLQFRFDILLDLRNPELSYIPSTSRIPGRSVAALRGQEVVKISSGLSGTSVALQKKLCMGIAIAWSPKKRKKKAYIF